MAYLEALKNAEEAGVSYEFCGNKKPKCPHCGNDFDIDENEAWGDLYQSDFDDVDLVCPSCDETFTVKIRVSYEFDTDDQPDDDDDA